MGETAIREYTNMSVEDVAASLGQEESVDFTDAQNISGDEFAGPVADASTYITAIVELMKQIDPTEYNLADLDTFEQVLVGVQVRKFHLMREKHKGYGEKNIKNDTDNVENSLRKLLTRMRDKIERADNLLGNPDTQVKDVRTILETLDEESTLQESLDALKAIHTVVNPQQTHAEESIEDTFMDFGNYGDIGYSVLMDAWAKPMESD
jgi:hypothetical protein